MKAVQKNLKKMKNKAGEISKTKMDTIVGLLAMSIKIW